MNIGKFVISLDLELMWGVNDVITISKYGMHIKGVHQVIPRLLKIFDQYGVNATFSTVGLLFFETKDQLLKNLPSQIPYYNNKNLSPYSYMATIGNDYKEDPYHFAPRLIELIKQYPSQEIGSHTFSHYYCLEEGQTKEDFRADLIQSQKIAAQNGININSLVFPRNQSNEDYLQVCHELGILCIRGNESSWLYEARSGQKENLIRRGIRFADSFINISGHNCYNEETLKKKLPINIPASRFLRPYSPILKPLDSLRLNRIKRSMSYAANNGLIYHLWWHPHNFGVNQDENFSFLEKILQHFKQLLEQYNFESHTMTSAAKKILKL